MSQLLIDQAYRLFDEFWTRTEDWRRRCRINEAFWRGEHWAEEQGAQEDAAAGLPRPVTPVLFSTLESLLADFMDHYPEPVLLGEEPGDDALAEELTQVVRHLMERRGYRATYREKCRSALKTGASVQEIFWDPALGTLGDVDIRPLDVRCFAWDPAFARLQDGRACFKWSFYPREWFASRWPGQAQELSAGPWRRDLAGSDDEIMLLEYWYKEYEGGASRVHMARLAGGVLLEDSRVARPEGVYAHGQYPFIVEPLYPVNDAPAGLGMIDLLRDMQRYADRMDQIILHNAMMSGQMKLLVNRNADIDEDALTDWSREVVRAGRIDDAALRWFQAAPLNPVVYTHHRNKLTSIKEESGQTQFNRGESAAGVTAASAIIALQEAGSKRSRTLIDQLYDGYAELIRMVLSVIAENYTERRLVRLRGAEGASALMFDAAAMMRGESLVDFDIRVQVQRQAPYRTLYQNELALQMLGAGLIEPAEALEMMDFEGKDRIAHRARQRAREGAPKEVTP